MTRYSAMAGALLLAALPASSEETDHHFRARMDVQAAVANQPLPHYQQQLKDVGVQGRVVLTARIDRDGHLGSDIATVSGHPLLARAARKALAKWRLDPTRVAPADITVAFNFVLRSSGASARARRGAPVASILIWESARRPA